MIFPIQTNRLNIHMDFDAYDKKYDIFRVATDESHFPYGTKILDTPMMCNGVCSVYYDDGNCFYVLMNKDISNKFRLMNVFHGEEDGKKVTVSEVESRAISMRAAVSLLLNALGTYEHELLRYNNLTGHLYCVNSKWISKNQAKQVTQIHCLEVSVTDDLCMLLHIRTFTSELLKKKIVFKKKKFEQYAKYILESGNTLRRRLDNDTQPGFILRQINGKRNTEKFMNVVNSKEFNRSKLSVLERVLRSFNYKYDGICELGFEQISEWKTTEGKKAELDDAKKRVVSVAMNEMGVKLIDMVQDESSVKLCKKIEDEFETQYNVKLKMGQRISRKSPNICIIHSAEYYNEDEDPYLKKYDGAVVQHITLENGGKGEVKNAVQVMAQDIVIKQDVKNKHMTLLDWSTVEINEDISFGICETIENINRFFFVKVRPDGSMEFYEKENTLFSSGEYLDCLNIFQADNKVDKSIEGIVCFANGDINVIRRTNLFTIPNITDIRKEFDRDNTSLRNKEKKDELFTPVTDIKLFKQGDYQYYFAGIFGYNMSYKMDNAANIRRIESYKGAPLRFEELLPLMLVTFVRNGQLTVLPFPFKYLREYVRTLQLSS